GLVIASGYRLPMFSDPPVAIIAIATTTSTSTATATPTKTPTVTQTPTTTPTPTGTPTATAVPTLTSTPTSTATPEPLVPAGRYAIRRQVPELNVMEMVTSLDTIEVNEDGTVRLNFLLINMSGGLLRLGCYPPNATSNFMGPVRLIVDQNPPIDNI